jgi:hypothetical protein
MRADIRRLWRLLVASWVFFLVLAIANASAVTAGWYCTVGGAR